MKYWRLLLLLTILLSPVFKANAHGLKMTTAEITLRHEKHLSITIKTSLDTLFEQMRWPGKPASLLHLAASDKKKMYQFRLALIKLFQPLPIQAGKHTLQSRQLRVPSVSELQRLIQAYVAEQALQKKIKNKPHNHNDRAYYLKVQVSGFISPRGKPLSANGVMPALQVVFPAVLGDILVNYTKPQTQTIRPSANAVYYRQVL